jgi:acyl carrier protein
MMAVEEAFEVEFTKEDQKAMRTLAEVAVRVRELQQARQVA